MKGTTRDTQAGANGWLGIKADPATLVPFLPASARAAYRVIGETHSVPEPPLKDPRATVLSVDDNDDLRSIMEVTLNFMGYRVISCSDADAASRAYRTCGEVDLLVTDLEMPGRSGVELARELCGLRPRMPVLIVSGAYISGELRQEIDQSSWRFLAKPYAVPDLLTNVHDLLGTEAAHAQRP